ncbi:hypothetical protein M407DRAFT_21977 [Tulasnella calospora MUT 4182]|uniref:Protein kinase domain-containing protein n=1 Tax=Tulasnella calospora MUT 4182 TaxID=1051891 RepID=A0A0C3QDA6_9AGAM|nr:hypothetical protein M407DRAFT_21977 [Tulasnella calospora MUT 4182]
MPVRLEEEGMCRGAPHPGFAALSVLSHQTSFLKSTLSPLNSVLIHPSLPSRPEYLMNKDQVDPSPSVESHQVDQGGRVWSSNSLREKLEKLEEWRIDASLIEFPEDPHEFHGGNAAVERAFIWVSRSDDEDNIDGPEHSSDELPSPDAPAIKPDGGAKESECDRQDKDGSQASNLHQEDCGGKDDEEETEEDGERDHEVGDEEQELDDEDVERKTVAVKKLKIADDTNVERVLGLALREMEFLIELNHANIVGVTGFVEDLPNNIVWLILPWEDNGNLRDFLASGNWEIPERISLVTDVTRGVEYLHSREPPICHGDLKSLNVLVNAEFDAVITDLGSARRLSNTNLEGTEEDEEGLPQSADLTASPADAPLQVTFSTSTNTITLTGNVYTLRWAAPELLMEDQASLWSDIWALGWIYYETMTNAIPFEDVSTDIRVVERVIQGDLPSITDDVRVSSIMALCSLMAQCWNILPRERPTAQECQSSIEWMPWAIPSRREASSVESPQALSPTLLIMLGDLHLQQDNYPRALSVYSKALSKYTNNGYANGRAKTLCALANVQRCLDKYEEAASLYSEALKICAEVDDRDGKATALRGLGCVSELQREYNTAISYHSQALQIYTDLQDSGSRADTLCAIAEVQLHQTKFSDALANYSQALSISTDAGNSFQMAIALCGLGNTHRLREDPTEAISCHTRALDLYNADGNDSGRATALCGLGIVHHDQRELNEAISCYSKALQVRAKIGDTSGSADALRSLGLVYSDQDRYDDAISKYSEALQISIDIGDRSGRAETLRGLADLYRRQEQYAQALAHYSEALQISIEISEKGGQSDAWYGIATVYYDQDEYDAALSHFGKALKVRGDIGDMSGQAEVLDYLAEVCRLQEKYDDAISYNSKALQVRTEIGDAKGRAHSFCNLAEVYHSQEQYEDAISHYSEALHIFADIGDTEGRANTLQTLVEVYRNQNRLTEALSTAEQAAALISQVGNQEKASAALEEVASIRELIEGTTQYDARPGEPQAPFTLP